MQLGGRLTVGCLATVALASPAAAAGPRPALLVLRAHDLGVGFVTRAGLTGPVSNGDAAHAGPAGLGAKLGVWQRRSGYQADFVRPVNAVTIQQGPLDVLSSASVYRSTAGAIAAFAYTRRTVIPPDAAPLSLGFRLGDESELYVVQRASALGPMLVYTVFWREGNVDSSIVLTGRVGVVSEADVVPLARGQETRTLAQLQRLHQPPHGFHRA